MLISVGVIIGFIGLTLPIALGVVICKCKKTRSSKKVAILVSESSVPADTERRLGTGSSVSSGNFRNDPVELVGIERPEPHAEAEAQPEQPVQSIFPQINVRHSHPTPCWVMESGTKSAESNRVSVAPTNEESLFNIYLGTPASRDTNPYGNTAPRYAPDVELASNLRKGRNIQTN